MTRSVPGLDDEYQPHFGLDRITRPILASLDLVSCCICYDGGLERDHYYFSCHHAHGIGFCMYLRHRHTGYEPTGVMLN